MRRARGARQRIAASVRTRATAGAVQRTVRIPPGPPSTTASFFARGTSKGSAPQRAPILTDGKSGDGLAAPLSAPTPQPCPRYDGFEDVRESSPQVNPNPVHPADAKGRINAGSRLCQPILYASWVSLTS